jgi:hypothetical protein
MGLEFLLQRAEQIHLGKEPELSVDELFEHLDVEYFMFSMKNLKKISEINKMKLLREEVSRQFGELQEHYTQTQTQSPAQKALYDAGVYDFREAYQKGKLGNFSQRFSAATGIWKGKLVSRQALIENRVLPGNLSAYESNPEQLDEILRHTFEDKSICKDYFDPKIVGEANASANRKLLFSRGIAKQFLASHGVHDFREVKKIGALNSIAQTFGTTTGLWQINKFNRKILVERGLLPGNLSTYESNPEQLDDILRNTFEINNSCRDYFNPQVVGEENASANQRIFRESHAFRQYLIDANIDLTEIENSNNKLKYSDKTILGLAGITLSPNQKSAKPTQKGQTYSYPPIRTDWSQDIAALTDYFTNVAFEDRLAYAKEHSEELENTFGRTLHAILLAADRHNICAYNPFGNGIKEDKGIIYTLPGPKSVFKPGEGGLTILRNDFVTLTDGYQPKEVWAFGYHAPVHAQHVHTFTPIHFKGSTLETYTEFEQQIIRGIGQYISPKLGQNTKDGFSLHAVRDPKADLLYTQIVLPNPNRDNLTYLGGDIQLPNTKVCLWHDQTPLTYREFRPSGHTEQELYQD